MTSLLLFNLAFATTAVEVAAVPGANLQRPVWSADGSTLAWEANFHDDKRVELHVGNADTRQFTAVKPKAAGASGLTAGFTTSGTSGKVAYELAFSPPSIGAYVFSASTDSQDYDLFVTGGSPLAPAPGADGGASWSPDGRYIAFTSSRTGEGDIYLIDTAATEAPPRQLSSDPKHSELDPTWSKDSTMLAWVGHSDEGDSLWLLTALDGTPERLTAWTGSQTRPRFSPTADQLAFYSVDDASGRFDLYVIDAKVGATPRKLIEGVVPNATGPAYTPSGADIIAVRDDDKSFDPIVSVGVARGSVKALSLGTVGNGDHAVVQAADGSVKLAWVAQGKSGDEVRDFKRLFVSTLP